MLKPGQSWQTGMAGHPTLGNFLKLSTFALSLHEGLKFLVFPLSLPLWFPCLVPTLMFKRHRPCHSGQKSSPSKYASSGDVPVSTPQTSWVTQKVTSFLPTPLSQRYWLDFYSFPLILIAPFCSFFLTLPCMPSEYHFSALWITEYKGSFPNMTPKSTSELLVVLFNCLPPLPDYKSVCIYIYIFVVKY